MFTKYSSYILCLLIAILVVAVYTADFSFLVRQEWKIQDLLYSVRSDTPFAGDICLVNIDDHALDKYGPWPWNRDRIGDLLAAVGTGEPKTVLMNIIFDYDVAQDTLDYTTILSEQLAWMKNVVVPYELVKAEFRSGKISNPDYLRDFAITVDNDLGILPEHNTLLARKIFMPPLPLTEFASGLGFKYNIFDEDKKIRWMPLSMHHEGYYYPSVELMTAARYLNIDPSLITINGGKSVQLGGITIPTNDRGEMFVNYGKPGATFGRFSAAEVLAEKVDLKTFKGKLIIISVTAENEAEYYSTPVSSRLEDSELTAFAIENIVHGNFLKRFSNQAMIDLITLFALGILFAFVLPRVILMYRLIIIAGTFIILANVTYVLFNSYGIMGRPLYIGIELFLLLLAVPIMDNEILSRLGLLNSGQDKITPASRARKAAADDVLARSGPVPIAKTASVETTQMGGSTALGNTAMEKTVSAQPEKAVMQEISAAQTKADACADYQTIKPADENPPADSSGWESDSGREISPLPEKPATEAEALSEMEMASQQSQDNEDAFSSTPTESKLRNLGRYKIIGLLGKGAMGSVYKGLDPAINRNVALKTIRLDFISDPEEFAELKERLFREARAAGVLSHPNIVTIYDVGTEGKLQYIAMEHIQGVTLEEMIRRKVKFNYRIIAQMITQICGALDYAHSQKIVHRDIKPANIMVQKDYTVKVMDFGIARVDSTSMTRTGIAMGTPNYIAPEQLQGKQVDHRCDIFSLGVMLYEMLTGRRPFHGENLTALIYSIINRDPEPPSTVDPAIPNLFDRVAIKALKKNPNERYQKAGDVAADLADFIQSFTPARKGSI